MNGEVFYKVVAGIIGTAIMGLSGFVWTANADIKVLQREQAHQSQQAGMIRDDMREMKQDVKEIRRMIEQRYER